MWIIKNVKVVFAKEKPYFLTSIVILCILLKFITQELEFFGLLYL